MLIFLQHSFLLFINIYFSVSKINLPLIADKIPPQIGARINNHNCLIASPPTNRAGPMLRARFADIPVTGIPTK